MRAMKTSCHFIYAKANYAGQPHDTLPIVQAMGAQAVCKHSSYHNYKTPTPTTALEPYHAIKAWI